MNAMQVRRAFYAVSLLGSVWAIATCGGKVVIDGDFDGEGGAGGTSNSAQSSGPQTVSAQASTGAGTSCIEETCAGLGTDECSCERTCGSALLEVKCAPNENKKLQCICSYDDVFSGACFETEGLACDIDKGCCAKYFQGI